mmetsp:Transcript_12750/g.24577  ORF Transcript_12750/g.24577 Transcript_12750/m.24577 type:complete len:292 (+) Transcript_12750:195-1070(+)
MFAAPQPQIWSFLASRTQGAVLLSTAPPASNSAVSWIRSSRAERTKNMAMSGLGKASTSGATVLITCNWRIRVAFSSTSSRTSLSKLRRVWRCAAALVSFFATAGSTGASSILLSETELEALFFASASPSLQSLPFGRTTATEERGPFLWEASPAFDSCVTAESPTCLASCSCGFLGVTFWRESCVLVRMCSRLRSSKACTRALDSSFLARIAASISAALCAMTTNCSLSTENKAQHSLPRAPGTLTHPLPGSCSNSSPAPASSASSFFELPFNEEEEEEVGEDKKTKKSK